MMKKEKKKALVFHRTKIDHCFQVRLELLDGRINRSNPVPTRRADLLAEGKLIPSLLRFPLRVSPIQKNYHSGARICKLLANLMLPRPFLQISIARKRKAVLHNQLDVILGVAVNIL